METEDNGGIQLPSTDTKTHCKHLTRVGGEVTVDPLIMSKP